MHYEDLTSYEYREKAADAYSLNVGWLGWGKPFAQGETSQAFKERLFQFCLDRYAVHLCRGYHECEFCGGWHDEAKAKYGEGASCLSIGNGEIRVIGETAVYAAPTLIYHYVVRHEYRPPDCFIEAVLTGPAPGSEEHEALLNKMEGRLPVQAATCAGAKCLAPACIAAKRHSSTAQSLLLLCKRFNTTGDQR